MFQKPASIHLLSSAVYQCSAIILLYYTTNMIISTMQEALILRPALISVSCLLQGCGVTVDVHHWIHHATEG